jgi:hypothetical protein
MFVLDSLGGTSKTTMSHLTKYLIKEATNRRKVDPVDFVRPTLYTTNVPKQDNSCDCGVFLLHFVDKFLNSPKQFVDILLVMSDMDMDCTRCNHSLFFFFLVCRPGILGMSNGRNRKSRTNDRNSWDFLQECIGSTRRNMTLVAR